MPDQSVPAAPELLRSGDTLAVERMRTSLLEDLRPLLAAIARKITIEHVAVGSGLLQRVRIDKVQLGAATVDRLAITGATAHLRSASAFLHNVHLDLELRLTLEWWYDFGIFGDDSGTESLGSLWFGLPVGSVVIPSLANLDLHIPSVAVDNLSASVPPIVDLELGPTELAGISAERTALPTGGLAVTGLGLGALGLSHVTVPGVTTREAAVDRLRPTQPLTVPSIHLANLSIPSTSIPNVTGGAFAFDAQASSRGVEVSFGIFGFGFFIQPVAHMQVGSLTLTDVSLSADVDSIALQGIHVPVEVRGVHIDGIQLNEVAVEEIKL